MILSDALLQILQVLCILLLVPLLQGIAVDERIKGATVRTPLGHIHFVVAQQDLGVDDPAVIRTDNADQLVKT